MGKLHPDFKELLKLLNAHNVDFLIVGGYAMAFHGAPRFTGDIDLFVKPDSSNAKRILKALCEFGFESMNLSQEDFTTPKNVVQFGFPPVRIDIINSLTGVSWEKANTGKIKGDLDKINVYFISKEDLITNKKTLGRQRDLADIEALDKK